MIELQVKPTIEMASSVQELRDILQVTEHDVIITNTYIYEPNFKPMNLPCHFLFKEQYGSGEPSDEMAEAMYRDLPAGIRRIVGIGGGSILDLAKIFALRQVSPVDDVFAGRIPAVKDKELVLIPATCGTGSEVTNISVLSFIQKKTKQGLAHDALYADRAILVGDLLQTLPFKFFATSSIDALVHAVESALSPDSTPSFRRFSYGAMEKILRGYMAIRDHGPEARLPLMQDFLLASTWAGIAFSIPGCAAVHALSYPLGAVYHVPHGESNYVMFTAVLTYYVSLKQDGEIATLNRFLADVLGCDESAVYTELAALLNVILPKKPLRAYGVTAGEIEEFAKSVVANQGRLLKHNFVPLSYDQIVEIYRSVY